MMAALLAASRGGETRAAELAREQLPDRYPYVYEFRKALELDPKNGALHRELAYLLLSMSEKEPALSTDAIGEFKIIVDASPDDYVAAAQLGLLYLRRRRGSTSPCRFSADVLDHAHSGGGQPRSHGAEDAPRAGGPAGRGVAASIRAYSASAVTTPAS